IKYINISHMSSIGIRKLDELYLVLQDLVGIRSQYLQQTYAVNFYKRKGNGYPEFLILRDATPAFTLHDMLLMCDSFPLDKTMVFLLRPNVGCMPSYTRAGICTSS